MLLPASLTLHESRGLVLCRAAWKLWLDVGFRELCPGKSPDLPGWPACLADWLPPALSEGALCCCSMGSSAWVLVWREGLGGGERHVGFWGFW